MSEICEKIGHLQRTAENQLGTIKGNNKDITAMRESDKYTEYDYDGAFEISGTLEKQATTLNETLGEVLKLIPAIGQSKDDRQRAQTQIAAALDKGDKKGFNDAMDIVAAETKNIETLGKQLVTLRAKVATMSKGRSPLRDPLDIIMRQIKKLDEVKELRKKTTNTLFSSINTVETLFERLLDFVDFALKHS